MDLLMGSHEGGAAAQRGLFPPPKVRAEIMGGTITGKNITRKILWETFKFEKNN